MRRVPWDVLLALTVGLGLGLAYAWIIAPRGNRDVSPDTLRTDFKDQYRSAIAAAFAATGDLPRARARLALLGDEDPVEALNAQAQRMLANSGEGVPIEQADLVAALAYAMDAQQSGEPPVESTVGLPETFANDENASTTLLPQTADPPFMDTDTPPPLEIPETRPSQPAVTEDVPIPRPTQTSAPTPGEPFTLTSQESICDPNLPDALLQVLVLNPNRRQIAGIKIVVTWDGGKEQFFTGLKPELGNGYADYIMAPGTTYTVQLAPGSDVALGIQSPTCQTPSGESFPGSIKLTYQQP